MNNKLKWHIFIRVSSREKAYLIIKRLEAKCGLNLNTVSCQLYWKDKSLFDVYLESDLATCNAKDVIFEMLQLSTGLGNERTVIGPIIYGNENFEFEIIITSTTVPGVDWMCISI